MNDDETDETLSNAEKHPEANAKADEEVARMSRTVQPGSAAPSRAGVQGSGSGADTEQGNAGIPDTAS